MDIYDVVLGSMMQRLKGSRGRRKGRKGGREEIGMEGSPPGRGQGWVIM